MAEAPRLNVTYKPVTSKEDILTLAHINDVALGDDPFRQWRIMFTEETEYSAAIKAMTDALTDPFYRVIKAVVPDPDNPSSEKIVGFIHYLHAGYIQLEKVDPFAPKPVPPAPNTANVTDSLDVSSNMAEKLHEKAEVAETQQHDPERADRLRRGENKFVLTRNVYISAIRGKRHMYIRRLMVLPEYQRKGIAGHLLRMVTDEADRLKIVCWLHSRPAGEPLYFKLGFHAHAVWDMDEPELKTPVFKSMMRLPQPVVDA